MRPADGDDGASVDAGGDADGDAGGGSRSWQRGEDWRGRAARVIQSLWRSRRFAEREADEAASGLAVSDDEGRTWMAPSSRSTACCIVCFALAPRPVDTLGKDDNALGEDGDVSLCADCAGRLAASDDQNQTRPGSSPLSSPNANANVPARLTQLLRVEAKVLDQLQLLRDQHHVLQAQQEQLQAAKRAQAEQDAAARALARERRRHVWMLLERRKREEEERFRQFEAPDEATETPKSTKSKAKKKPKPPVALTASPSSSKEAVEPPAEQLPAPPPPPKDKQADKRLQSEIQEHTRQLWQRRRQTLDCYSQDLTPLVDGSRPKRLPVPAALPAASARRKRSTTSKQPTASPVVADSVRPSNQGMKLRRHKKTPSSGVKLRPLPMSSKAANNQLDELEVSYYRAANTSAASPWAASSPLTAEIKPVSWIHELDQDLADDDACVATGLDSVVEGFEDDDGHLETPLQSQPHSKYKRYADLYGPDAGGSASSPSLLPTLLRPLPPPVAASMTAKTPAVAQPSGPWEYSTERLAGLLQKYNVSVKEAGGKS